MNVNVFVRRKSALDERANARKPIVSYATFLWGISRHSLHRYQRRKEEGGNTRISILSFNPPFLFPFRVHPREITIKSRRTNEMRGKKDRWGSARNGRGKRQRRGARKRWREVGKGGREKRREYDFDRGKVGALDREASREGGTIGSSPCRSAWGKRDSFSPVRDSAFSVERVLLLLYHVYNLTPYFIFRHFPESKESNKRFFIYLRCAR